MREALSFALASSSDPRLDDASLLDVRISPGAGPLVVLVSAPAASIGDVESALDAAHGRFRSEVAQAIHRKRAPDLSFAVVPEGAAPEQDPWQ